MARRERDIVAVLLALAAAGLLIVLFQAPTPRDAAQIQESNPRIRRDDGDDGDDGDEGCGSFSFNDDGTCDQDGDPTTGMGRSSGGYASEEGQLAKKGKKKKDVDYGAFMKQSGTQSQINNLVNKMEKYLQNFHKKVESSQPAALNPNGGNFDIFSNKVSAGTSETWSELRSSKDVDCSYGADGRLSSATQHVFLMYPFDMPFMKTGMDMGDVWQMYVDFYSDLHSNIGSGPKTIVGTYASNSAVRLNELRGSDTVAGAMASLSPNAGLGFNIYVRSNSLRVLQPNMGKMFGKFLSVSRKYTKRDMDLGAGETCFSTWIIHTVPSDYKHFAAGTFQLAPRKKCNMIPIMMRQPDQEQYFTTMVANFYDNGANMANTYAEAGLRPYMEIDMSNSVASFGKGADQLVSHMCSVENRVQCMMSKAAWFAAVDDLDREATTTTGQWTSTTTEWTSTASSTTDGTTTSATTTTDFTSTTTTSLGEDKQCCGCSAGAATFDANKEYCCSDEDGNDVKSSSPCS